jgi:two-component system response regulator
MLILMIDDNLADIDLVRHAMLECDEEVEVFGVADAVRAFSVLARQGQFAGMPRPDLILMDISMPMIDGIKALGIIKSTPDWADIPVMILTSSGLTSERERSIRLGAVDHHLKPTSFDGYLRLVSRIQEVIARRGSRVDSGEWRVDSK